MRMRAGWALGLVLLFGAVACEKVTGVDCPSAMEGMEGDVVCVEGAVQYFGFEGGFWAVRGDDSVTYDPLGGIPADFRQAGLPVTLVARIRNDMASIHMAGPIVEILRLERR